MHFEVVPLHAVVVVVVVIIIIIIIITIIITIIYDWSSQLHTQLKQVWN